MICLERCVLLVRGIFPCKLEMRKIRHRFISYSLNSDFHYAVAILNVSRESGGNKGSLAIRGT